MNRVFGLDIGFGDVKAVFENGEKISMPTAVVHAKAGTVELGEYAGSNEECLYQGKSFLVGKGALEKSLSTRSFDFLKKYAPLLAYKVMKDAMSGKQSADTQNASRKERSKKAKGSVKETDNGIPDSLAIGLPLAYYTQQNRDFFVSALRRFEVNGESFRFDDIEVFPQGVGILLDYRLNDEGHEKPGTDVDGLVVDIGFNTVDVVAFSGGSAIKGESAMFERAGVSRIAQDLMQKIQSDTGLNLSEQEAKQVLLEGKIKVYGAEKDFSVSIEEIVEDYLEGILNTLTSRWEDRLQRSSVLLIGGGGAHYMKAFLPERYRNIVHIPDDPEFSNARGFRKAFMAKKFK
ncbi:MAG: ParM/StbA family protein [Nitrospinota bacterium]|nr:ParM/StbA family protein [Nitrospinota bacterium]